MIYTFFLGTNMLLSASEIVSYLKRQHSSFTINELKDNTMRIEMPNPLPQDTIKYLGGTIRIAQEVTTFTDMPNAEEILEALSPLPNKWQVGISAHGIASPGKALAISIKKSARAQGSKLSFIEPKRGSSMLNAAQVIFNKLTEQPNAELIIAKNGETYRLLTTIAVQDIASYELRDTSRPARDARVGLLPPKLAQIMINFANPKEDDTIYDPFCGMGTILQESWNMGFASIGSDASKRMLKYSEKNLAWFAQHFSCAENLAPNVFLHDVTQAFPEYLLQKHITVVTEPFLGTPLIRPLSPTELELFHKEVMELYVQFFKNIREVLQPNSRLLVLLPAPKSTDGQIAAHTPLPRSFIDEIMTFGYRKVQLVPQEVISLLPNGAPEIVLYARPDAMVAREFTLWETV